MLATPRNKRAFAAAAESHHLLVSTFRSDRICTLLLVLFFVFVSLVSLIAHLSFFQFVYCRLAAVLEARGISSIIRRLLTEVCLFLVAKDGILILPQ